MIPFACSSADAVEQSLLDYEIHQDAQPEETPTQREEAEKGIARYIEKHLIADGRKNQREQQALNYFCLRMAEHFDEDLCLQLAQMVGVRECRVDAGMRIAKIVEDVARETAEQYRENLEQEARGWGYIK